MTTLTPEELITTLEATSQFNDNADICMEDIIATLQAQAERIKELEMEAEQLRKCAFEEAAKICDSYHCTAFGPADCAEKIRNLLL